MKHHHVQFRVAYLVLAFAVYFIIFSLIPYSWYADVTKYELADICVGEDTIPVYNEREMIWPLNHFGIRGDVWSQAVLFEDELKLETTIYRDSNRADGRVDFGYEPNSIEANFNIRLDEPIDHAGEYGLNEWVSINPLPFVWVSKFVPAEDTRFNVIDCSGVVE